MAFIDEFRTRGDISFVGMRNAAMALLPTDKVQLNRLYEDLKRGTDILKDGTYLYF